jgi:U32 family peptidase
MPAKRPEVLAPAGTPESMKAAVETGADAVYFGLERWNARERAQNFKLADLPSIMGDLHRRGVKGYVTFNTLIYESELAPAEEMLRAIGAAGTDAIIVQDLGAVRLARACAPGLPVHASTQMTITDAASAELARSLGVERAVLARELSTDEILTISRGTPLELEVFVHGALCVSFSGQCFTSASWGGRSANRGECAQACRLPYDLLVDGIERDLGPVRYLLSPHDLAGYDAVPALIDAGVVSFKIEGRLKGPEYVAATVQAYRTAVDRALAGRRKDVLTAGERAMLAQVYSRGPSAGFLGGTNHQSILEGTYPRHRGMRLGQVVGVDAVNNGVVVLLEEEAKVGDGVLLAGGDPETEEPGGRVSGLEVQGREVERAAKGQRALLIFERRSVDVALTPAQSIAWRTADPELAKRLRASFEGDDPHHRSKVDLSVEGRPGAPLVVTATDDAGHAATARTEAPLAPAARSPLGREVLADKLGRLGGTPFELGELEVALEGACHVPVSELNRVRRELVAALEAARAAPPERPVAPPDQVHALLGDRPARTNQDAPPVVVPLCRDDAHLEGALAAGAREVYLEWMEMVGLRRAVDRARAAGVTVGVVPPRIQKPGDEKVLEACLRLAPDALLVRSLGALEWVSRLSERPRLHGDFSLNAANAIGARTLLDRGLLTFVPSYDLSFAELERLLQDVDPGRAEVVVHQHVPMFHTEYCAYARLLSSGTSFKDCGRPCERHKVSLRDRTGVDHPVLVDVGCRNTVFSAQPNSVADDLPRLLALGVRRFRVELLREDAKQAEERVRGYLDVVAGKKKGAEVRARAGAARRLGVLRVEG